MKLYLSQGRTWTGTQSDAKHAQGGNDYETIEVPTDKPSLLAWLNARWEAFAGVQPRREDAAPAAEPVEEAPAPPADSEQPQMRAAQMERFEALARKLGWSPPGEAATSTTLDDVEEMIASAEGNDLIRLVSASVSRLGTFAGLRGWAAFAKNVYAWSPGSKATEQGLGMLMLAALNHLGEKSEQSDQSTT